MMESVIKSESVCLFNKLVSIYNKFVCLGFNGKFNFIWANFDPEYLNWEGVFKTYHLEENMHL